MPYPAVSNAPLSAKHAFTLAGTITLNIDEVDSYCGTNNGSVLVHASGGTPPYTYSFDNGPYQSSALYITDGPFNHSVSVKDASGQVVTQTVYVGNNGHGPSVFAASYTQPTGCSKQDASITLRGSGGTPPYQYSWDMTNWQTSPTFAGLAYGWYYFYAKDANGCVSNGLWWPWDGCVEGGGSIGGSSCDNSGSISFTAESNGDLTGPFQYSMDGIHWQDNGNFAGLPSGVNILQVKDVTGKIGFFEEVIFDGCRLTLQTTVTDAACGQSDGQIVASATNGTGPYAYSIDGLNFQNSGTFTGLPAGTYTVWTHDLTGTLVSVEVQVMAACPTVSAVATDAFCGNNNGSITATGQSGTTPYKFSINGVNFQTSPLFSPLAPGAYTITIKDAAGFQATTTATVGNNCLQVTATPTNTSCGNPNGAILAAATGGTPPYTFSIGGAFQTNPAFPGLVAGNYTLTAMDQSLTTRSITLTLTDAGAPTMTVTAHAVDCNGQGGSLTIDASGGTSPLTYSDGGNYGPGNVFNSAAGNYILSVKDANGCVATQSATVAISCLHLTITAKNTSCGQNNGEIDAAASGGTPGYEYSIDNGTTWQASPLFSALAPGNYTILCQDATGLSNSITAQLTTVCITGIVTTTDASCGLDNGVITIQPSGGIAPYTYAIDAVHFQTAGRFSSLAPGNYTVVINDANGFSGTATASISAIPLPSIAVQAIPATCTDNDGVIDIDATGGTPPYQFMIDQSSAVASSHFTGLSNGVHQAGVMDARGCIAQTAAVIPLNNTLTAGIASPAPICQGKQVLLAAVSNAENFSWTPQDGLNKTNILTPEASPSATTAYTLTASTGVCQQTTNVTVTVYPAPVADAGTGVSICFGASTQLHGSGGNTYVWTPALYLSDPTAPDPEVKDPLNTITYTLTVTDERGCVSLSNNAVVVTVTPLPAVWIGNDTSILAGQPVPMVLQDVNGSGFESFSWSPATGLDDASIRDPVASPQESITYTVLAGTAAGCQAQGTRSIKVYSGVADIFVPNAFTPNGDGHNDVLHALPVGIRDFKYFAVFSRWGQRVFYTTDPAKGWDGSTAGHYVPATTYVWIAAGVDYRGVLVEHKGTVILVR
jgi:gliding motility-associated-like protein